MTTDTTVEIVPTQPEDVRAVQEVVHKTWRVSSPNAELGITVEDIDAFHADLLTDAALAARAANIRDPKPGEVRLVAKTNGHVIGMCYGIELEAANKLSALYLLPEYQGKGIGYRLWDAARLKFNTAKPTILHVATYNAKAIAFYEKLGFIKTGKEWQDEKFKMKSGAIIPQLEMMRPADTL